MYYRSIVLLVALAAFFSAPIGPANAQSAKQLRVGIDGTYPPFSHRNLDGEYSGFDIDLTQVLCQAMKVKCTMVQFDWDNLIAALRGDKVDFVIAAIEISQQKRELVAFSEPYLAMPSAIIVRKESILSGLEVEDLKDAQLGVLESSPHGEYLRTHRPQAHVKLYQDENDIFVDLINRQVDGVIGNPVILGRWLQSKDALECCRWLGTLPHDPLINGEGLGIAIALENDKLQSRLNKALKALGKSKKWTKIIRTHLPYLK